MCSICDFYLVTYFIALELITNILYLNIVPVNMTSENELLKTNELLRRRKLRLQQVREQSKDIAKKLRQRAKVENLRKSAELNSTKESEYFLKQEKLIKHLEQLYARGVSSVGESHLKATEAITDDAVNKQCLSQLRGKEAVAELRRQKQEKLDLQKKQLDRRLLAREAANELSREKSTTAKKTKNQTKSSSDLCEENTAVKDVSNKNCHNEPVNSNDMATQWESDELPKEWEPNVPYLSLPKDDVESLKDLNNITQNKSENSKRLDLFAVSSEMPSSLRGGFSSEPRDRSNIKPSSIVSEYLQSRSLRLRETDSVRASNKPAEDLRSIKETILRTRSMKPEGKAKEKSSNPNENELTKKSSVTMYNHSTRNCKDVPNHGSSLVVRDLQNNEDAYAQAMRHSSYESAVEEEHSKRLQAMRSKVAMTKQTVDKEYNDTMSFLKSLPKEKCTKHMKTSFMDERRQQSQKDQHQQKLRQEFRNIEKECGMNCKSKQVTSGHNGRKHSGIEDASDKRNMQYSWMPVPESDGNLAIHTILTSKQGKPENSVKFSQVDSYHEYRSRHKHTPPTKDTNEKHANNKIIIDNDEDISDNSVSSSDTSSVENLNIHKSDEKVEQLSNPEKIIVYKVLNAKTDKKKKKTRRLQLIDDVAKILSSMESYKSKDKEKQDSNKLDDKVETQEVKSNVPLDHINEGIYKTVKKQGDNISSFQISDKSREQCVLLTEEDIRVGRPCTCSKNVGNCRDSRREAASAVSCGGDDVKALRTTICKGCNCGCVVSKTRNETSNAALHTSEATSTSSFKTAATSDKARCPLPDEGYVKLVDDDGQEAGKFYIGASGFIKDDAYEVLIQLRKKDSVHNNLDTSSKGQLNKSKENIKNDVDVNICSENEVDKEDQIAIESNEQNQHSISHLTKSISAHDEVNNEVLPVSNSEKSVCKPDQKIEEPIAITKNPLSKKFVDKAVTTSQLSFDMNNDTSKADDFPRPATSTYTQTTLNSTPKQAFIHMSSSTSTAYMSPPEMVYPESLRRDRNNKIYTRCKTTAQNFEIMEHHVFDDESGRCSCSRCLRYERYITEQIKMNINGDRKKSHTSTPPNSTRNDENFNNGKDKHTLRKKIKKCKKCVDRLKTNSKNLICNCKKNQHVHLNKISSNIGSNASKPFKYNKSGKPNLNPVVKNYVNKLLELNRNSLKAIEITNQECSSVATPGSSIIEIPQNKNNNINHINNKISLEQIRNTLRQQILQECLSQPHNKSSLKSVYRVQKTSKSRLPFSQPARSAHKVKSLNISKKITKPNNINLNRSSRNQSKPNSSTSSTSAAGDFCTEKTIKSKSNCEIKSTSSSVSKSECSKEIFTLPQSKIYKSDTKNRTVQNNRQNCCNERNYYKLPLNKATNTSQCTELKFDFSNEYIEEPTNTSTQTNNDIDSELNLLKLAEDKIQNMEKIADLTEKCTERLSNLAKVLEEVRRNKSLAYSQISNSDTGSDSERKCVGVEISSQCANNPVSVMEKVSIEGTDVEHKESIESNSEEYIPLLKDIPKPEEFKYSAKQLLPKSNENENPICLINSHIDEMNKARTKPPPALSRIHLKDVNDVIPHELSTVIEVDSPMSVKLKSRSSKHDTVDKSAASHTSLRKEMFTSDTNPNQVRQSINPDLLLNSYGKFRKESKALNKDFSDDSKLQMMDLKQFNEVMLKPFITLQEYANQRHVGVLDEGSNLDDVKDEELLNDELSSMHSDGSLPDVIAELLKRNVIAEPFKFESISNVNSTTVSSESTLSVLALSNVRKQRKKASIVFHNKENVSESSESLSMSSNPDLENAFKKLGLGWASSTLKKTKERLALSSSTNTSSSSLTQFKVKDSNNLEIPSVVTDSVLSTKTSKRSKQSKNEIENSKSAEQQTSFSNSMTVKEFLTNELANKITFTNKSQRNETEEFVSMIETKLPDELKDRSQSLRGDRTADSLHNGNRARTSTPVQIYKSLTYHSSSSSNLSNGLFSNADELSSVKGTSNSIRNHSTSEKDDLTVPNCSLKVRKGLSDCSKSE